MDKEELSERLDDIARSLNFAVDVTMVQPAAKQAAAALREAHARIAELEAELTENARLGIAATFGLQNKVAELEADKALLDWLLSAKRVYLFSPSKTNPHVGDYLADRDDINKAMRWE